VLGCRQWRGFLDVHRHLMDFARVRGCGERYSIVLIGISQYNYQMITPLVTRSSMLQLSLTRLGIFGACRNYSWPLVGLSLCYFRLRSAGSCGLSCNRPTGRHAFKSIVDSFIASSFCCGSRVTLGTPTVDKCVRCRISLPNLPEGWSRDVTQRYATSADP
jgi:hypothetical protein